MKRRAELLALLARREQVRLSHAALRLRAAEQAEQEAAERIAHVERLLGEKRSAIGDTTCPAQLRALLIFGTALVAHETDCRIRGQSLAAATQAAQLDLGSADARSRIVDDRRATTARQVRAEIDESTHLVPSRPTARRV
ncbi:hypothetical protein EV663_105100 [Rhodovulum bhavnagarense]|uniref:Uncharacterized protein n=1 Tax=Rhodovulum bhavnagarense TaxID=992286 RepID=A0A4R2RD77_9RHOB|nr:hypothetical protein [Rhodovulum bhavnagarense]TCP61382.1 hypothetical protein EV663_105100 [Rhodovulum bhavnagarense]